MQHLNKCATCYLCAKLARPKPILMKTCFVLNNMAKKKSFAETSIMEDMTSMFGTGVAGAGMGIGLGAIGTAAGAGSTGATIAGRAGLGIANMTAQFPTMGTMSGIKPLLKTTMGLGEMMKGYSKKRRK